MRPTTSSPRDRAPASDGLPARRARVECDAVPRHLRAGPGAAAGQPPPRPRCGRRCHIGACALAGAGRHARQGSARAPSRTSITVREADLELFARVPRRAQIPADKAARQVRKQRLYAAIPPAPPLPEAPFGVILADPPWQMGAPDTRSCPENHYPTMSLADIEALQIPAADDARLVLVGGQFTAARGPRGHGAPGALPTGPISCWVKPSIGPGNWARQRHELVLVGTRGEIGTPREEDRPDSVIEAPGAAIRRSPTSSMSASSGRIRGSPSASCLPAGSRARGGPPGVTRWCRMSDDRLLTAQEVAEILCGQALLGARGHPRPGACRTSPSGATGATGAVRSRCSSSTSAGAAARTGR